MPAAFSRNLLIPDSSCQFGASRVSSSSLDSRLCFAAPCGAELLVCPQVDRGLIYYRAACHTDSVACGMTRAKLGSNFHLLKMEKKEREIRMPPLCFYPWSTSRRAARGGAGQGHFSEIQFTRVDPGRFCFFVFCSVIWSAAAPVGGDAVCVVHHGVALARGGRKLQTAEISAGLLSLNF